MWFVEFSDEQRRQLDVVQETFAALVPLKAELATINLWSTAVLDGEMYVCALNGPVRVPIGSATPELLREKDCRSGRRKILKTKAMLISKRIERMAAINRNLGIGRINLIAARILREFERDGSLGNDLLVLGAGALHAYETACNVTISHVCGETENEPAVAELLLAARGIKRKGLMGLLRRVDRSFAINNSGRAENSAGLTVNLLCPETDDFAVTYYLTDLLATPMPGISWLLAAPRFEQTIICEGGLPVRIVVPEPRTFALFNIWTSRFHERPRDAAHATLIAKLATAYMRKDFIAKQMPWLPTELRTIVKDGAKLAKVKRYSNVASQ